MKITIDAPSGLKILNVLCFSIDRNILKYATDIGMWDEEKIELGASIYVGDSQNACYNKKKREKKLESIKKILINTN